MRFERNGYYVAKLVKLCDDPQQPWQVCGRPADVVDMSQVSTLQGGDVSVPSSQQTTSRELVRV